MAGNNRGQFQKKPMVQGAGPSKTFAAPEGTFVDGKVDLGDGKSLMMAECHVAGVPMADMPEDVQAKILFQQTDEGIAWWNANRHRLENREQAAPSAAGRGNRLPSGREATDPADKEILRFRDDLINDLPFDEQHDPLRVMMEQNLPEGHAGLWISELKADKEGLRRGVLDYQPVLVEKDGKLQRVQHGRMFLASVPKERADRAKDFYADKAKDRMVAAEDRVREQAEQIKGERDVRRTRGSDRDFFGGLQDDDPEVAAQQIGL